MAKASKITLVVIVILAIVAIALVGYRYSMKKSGTTSATTATTTGTTKQITPGSTSVTYTDAVFGKGTQILAPTGKLAAGFSNTIVYPGSTIVYSYERDFATYTQLTTALTSTDPAANINAFYVAYFKANNYTLISNKNTATPETIDYVSPGSRTRAHVQIAAGTAATASTNTVTISFLTSK
jgi:hypothetical protein